VIYNDAEDEGTEYGPVRVFWLPGCRRANWRITGANFQRPCGTWV